MWDVLGGEKRVSLSEEGVFAHVEDPKEIEKFDWPNPDYLDFSSTLAKVEKAAEYVKSEKAELIVVGFPKNMNNTIGERAEKCTLFGQRLEEMTGVKVVMWDERCTTVSAHQYLNETNVRGKKRKNIVDAVAAVIILESYLGYRKNTREQ